MIKGCTNICSAGCALQLKRATRFIATTSKDEARKRRSQLFEEEKLRQRAAVGRIEKIIVKYSTFDEDITLSMNKHLSTPYDVARHISEGIAKMSALAVVNGVSWDMHKPLVEDCEIHLSTMKTPHDRSVNNAFWRSCSLMLGAVAETAFRDDIQVQLHSFLSPNIKSGSFFYDVELGLKDWEPTNAEMKAISAIFVKLTRENLLFERLVTNPRVALEIFKDNPHKTKQIPGIASANDDNIVLYRIGDHVDISKGPMIGNTGLIGRTTIAAIHKIQSEDGVDLRRFQGVAIPNGIIVNHFTYGILEERAKKLNETAWIPQQRSDDNEEQLVMTANN